MRSSFWIVVALAALTAAEVHAQAPAPAEDPAVIRNPNWIKKPKPDDLVSVWPAEAMRRGISGRGVISCDVSEEGTLRGCVVASEEPAGMGFGAAALALAPTFRMTPKTVNGRPVAGGRVRIPIIFKASRPQRNVEKMSSLTNPLWREAPTRADLAAARPKGLSGDTGRAVMDCKIAPDGGLKDCRPFLEEPKNRGLRDAAKRLVPRFRVETKMPNGRSAVGAMVRVPIQFSPDAEGPQLITKPEWGRLPTGQEAGDLYPAKARTAGVESGEVMLECPVGEQGVLVGCRVLREKPEGLGFGEAALKLAPSFRMKAWTTDGRPVDGARVRIPISYRLPEEPVQAAP